MNVRKPGENRNTADCYYAWRCLPATEQRAIRLIYAHKKAEQISISGGLTKVNNLFLRGPIPGMCTCERMASHQSPPSAITSILSVCIFNYKEVLCSVCEGMHAQAWVDRGAMWLADGTAHGPMCWCILIVQNELLLSIDRDIGVRKQGVTGGW